jgi:hypothetical protein
VTVTDGEYRTEVGGWAVIYPAHCNGRLADLAFIVGPWRSDFVHFDPTDGHAYGTPMPKAVAKRAERMREVYRITLNR